MTKNRHVICTFYNASITGGAMKDIFEAMEDSDYTLTRMMTFLEKGTIYIYDVEE